MVFQRYRYVCLLHATFLLFHDACSRFIGPLAMIGGMVKKNCSDTSDKGELCWSENLQASFIGAYFYGYALQMGTAYLAARVGYRGSTMLATGVSGVIQLTAPLSARYSGVLATVLQGVKGLAAGVFMANVYDCATKWGWGKEGKFVISLGGTMLYAGFGAGPFIAGQLSERLGWEYPFYINGGVFILLFIWQCFLVPEEPIEARLMLKEEKMVFREMKRESESEQSSESAGKHSVNLRKTLSRGYLYCLCLYNIAHLFLTYPEQTVVPFYFNKFLGTDTEDLTYLQLGLSFTTVVSGLCWKSLLPFWDRHFSWFKCRMGFLIFPIIIRSVNLSLVPFTDNLSVSITLLVINNMLVGTSYAGGMMTIMYELDPSNGSIVSGICNGVGQAAGILIPLIRAGITNVGVGSEEQVRWRGFFVLCGLVGLSGALGVVFGVVCRRQEWKRHDSCLVDESEGSLSDNTLRHRVVS